MIPKSFTFQQNFLSGTIAAPPSKSVLHRILIASAIANFPMPPLKDPLCDDIIVTQNALAQFPFSEPTLIDCRDSASTLRFLLPLIAACATAPVTVTGSPQLAKRPISELTQTLRDNGAEISSDTIPLVVSAPLKSSDFRFSSARSSQFLSGILFAAAYLKDATITLDAPPKDFEYARLTMEVLAKFNLLPKSIQHRYTPRGLPTEIGDWSCAATWLCAGVLGNSPITVTNLSQNSMQPDGKIVDILRQFGATVNCTDTTATAIPSQLTAINLDISSTPDLLPVLAITAASAHGTSRFYNAANLRLKESDRLSAVAEILSSLGVNCSTTDDSIAVTGGSIHGGAIASHNDHRMVMAAAVASVRADGDITIDGADSVCKSYPAFFQDYKSLSSETNHTPAGN